MNDSLNQVAISALTPQVIIVGGGPVGVLLAIELGRQQIDTLIIEKHVAPQKLVPKAQSLNPRTMEYFRKLGLATPLRQASLVPKDYPLNNSWCSALNGDSYASLNPNSAKLAEASSETYLRTPLWITEAILRQELAALPSVTFLLNTEVIELDEDTSTVVMQNRDTLQRERVQAAIIVGCDGANSSVRQQLAIALSGETVARPVLNVLFESEDLQRKLTVPLSVIYYILGKGSSMNFGSIDGGKLWYAQIANPPAAFVEAINVPELLFHYAGLPFQCDIKHASIWLTQARIAEHYQKGNFFLAGDAAHIMPHVGGHGLNTGVGDAVNLAWKIIAHLQGWGGKNLLASYEIERKAVAMRNVAAAEDNRQQSLKLAKQFPPAEFFEEFVAGNIKLAQQHTLSLGLALGYDYAHSPLIMTNQSVASRHNSLMDYSPASIPGHIAPHVWFTKTESLYDKLSNGFSLLVTGISEKADIAPLTQAFAQHSIPLSVVNLPLSTECQQLYPKRFTLVRPDWHVAWQADTVTPAIELQVKHMVGL